MESNEAITQMIDDLETDLGDQDRGGMRMPVREHRQLLAVLRAMAARLPAEEFETVRVDA